MLRDILAAIGGYIVMVIVVFIGIGLAWAVLGGEGAFAGEGPEPSTVWTAMNIVFGFLAAVVGGYTARRLGHSAAAVKILVGLVLALGLVFALTTEWAYETADVIDKPVAEMTFTEAGEHARNPVWYPWLIPLVGAAGVLVGGRSRS